MLVNHLSIRIILIDICCNNSGGIFTVGVKTHWSTLQKAILISPQLSNVSCFPDKRNSRIQASKMTKLFAKPVHRIRRNNLIRTWLGD